MARPQARVKSAQSKGDWEGGPRGSGAQEKKWELGSSWLESMRGMETSVRRTFRKAWWRLKVGGMAGGRHKVTKAPFTEMVSPHRASKVRRMSLLLRPWPQLTSTGPSRSTGWRKSMYSPSPENIPKASHLLPGPPTCRSRSCLSFWGHFCSSHLPL